MSSANTLDNPVVLPQVRLQRFRSRKRVNQLALFLSLLAMLFGLFWLFWILFDTVTLGVVGL
ncbi:MAG: phosphate ABC transporter permease PtsA, partial [Rhodoferax sp.]|nr:phosphate ABC transporter permease PtsA [Rhodoferax sp.]